MWRGWFCSCFLPQIFFRPFLPSLYYLFVSVSLSLSRLLDTAGLHVCKDGLDWESVKRKEVWPRIWMIGKRKGGRGMWQREWPRIVETPPHSLFEANSLLTLTWWGFRPILLPLWVPHCIIHAGDWIHTGSELPQSDKCAVCVLLGTYVL